MRDLLCQSVSFYLRIYENYQVINPSSNEKIFFRFVWLASHQSHKIWLTNQPCSRRIESTSSSAVIFYHDALWTNFTMPIHSAILFARHSSIIHGTTSTKTWPLRRWSCFCRNCVGCQASNTWPEIWHESLWQSHFPIAAKEEGLWFRGFVFPVIVSQSWPHWHRYFLNPSLPLLPLWWHRVKHSATAPSCMYTLLHYNYLS